MAQFRTHKEISDKVKNDLDLLDEDFITVTTMNGFIDYAIDKCEALIHTIYEDYFLQKTFIPLTTGTPLYQLPTNIYGNKIRKILYRAGDRRYELFRIRRIRDTLEIQQDEDYSYVIVNPRFNKTGTTDGTTAVITALADVDDIQIGMSIDVVNSSGVSIVASGSTVTAIGTTTVTISNIPTLLVGATLKFGGYHLEFFPSSQETSVQNITIWYIRQANRADLSASQQIIDATIIDIPEFTSYIVQFVKTRCLEFEGNPGVLKAMKDLKEEEVMINDTLSSMVIDENNLIQYDLEFYNDWDWDSYINW